MALQFLEFDCSEDSEGVVCWDALAQPAAHHTPALLEEVAQVLAWAHHFTRGPGPLEEGAEWDFDLHLYGETGPIQTEWDAPHRRMDLQRQPTSDTAICLSLSISGTPAFAQAFRDHWKTP